MKVVDGFHAQISSHVVAVVGVKKAHLAQEYLI